ncbi:MAG: hypothetical protein CVV27_02690 [Candidatus Melainabacteria bacterium HGW-Melainabacteria-1]|nr:MAG: hypothetical protein CVV27_02690 [Candidatus Melainabacteria bacterium HGW-Melainabacteria-1]
MINRSTAELRQALQQVSWLDQFETYQQQTSSGGFELRLSQPGLVLLTVHGNMDAELTQNLFAQLEALYLQLTSQRRKSFLMIDALALEHLSFAAQRLVFARQNRADRPAELLSFHVVIENQMLIYSLRLLQRLNPSRRDVLCIHSSRADALALISPQLRPSTDDLRGPELREDALLSEHATLKFYQPDPQILICQAEGITNAAAARHMIQIHGRHMTAQRQTYGRSIIIVDSSKSRHSTIEAYRIMRGELGEAAPQAQDHIIVVSPRWPKAVSKLVETLLPNPGFSLYVVANLEAALATAEACQQAPNSAVRRKAKRHKSWFRRKELIAAQAAEIAQLKQERDDLLLEAGQLMGDILLHKRPEEIHQIPAQAFKGPFQELYEGLYMLQHDYQEYLVTLQQEIDERIQAEHRAAELSQLKSRFLANASHELRTPLNSIIGFTNLVLGGKGGDLNPAHRQYIGRVHDNSMHLLALINDVLDISKIESGTLRLEWRAVQMQEFLLRLLEPLNMTALRKSLTLQLDIDPQAPECLYSDPDRLRQILTNLVFNAIKFTDHGSISVRYRRWDSVSYPFALEVEDTGIGISKADQKKVFEAFCQVHNGNYAGSGLGLSICASLGYLLGCQLELESELGKGTLFRVLIPASSNPENSSSESPDPSD